MAPHSRLQGFTSIGAIIRHRQPEVWQALNTRANPKEPKQGHSLKLTPTEAKKLQQEPVAGALAAQLGG